MLLRNVGEGVAIALDSIRANKLRSALTILGVVIGVTTVMAVASLVQGIRRQIFNAIEVAGPTTFYVIRFFSQTPLNPDRLPYEVGSGRSCSGATRKPFGGCRRCATPGSGCRSSRRSSTRGHAPSR